MVVATTALSCGNMIANAQDTDSGAIVIEPLFEYPVAPDSLVSLTEKSDYLVKNFWNPMDFKKKGTVDQNALNDAFMVFVSPMRWANEQATDMAIKQLLQNLSKNPTLQLQFTRAAEEALYGPRAMYWADNVYLRFVDSFLSAKKIPDARKERYRRHKKLLENSRLGETPKVFRYTTAAGTPAHYQPDGVITIIEFGDPTCDECRLARLKLETDVALSTLVEKGLVNLLFVIPDAEEGWQNLVKDYTTWHVGASDEVADIYDIRATPSLYVIDSEGKIAAKNVDVRQAIQKAKDEVAKKQNPSAK